MPGPTAEFWNERFRTHTTGWDRGTVHPQLLHWIAEGTLKPCRILVPGCGAGHEVLHLAAAGFEVTALDYAEQAVALVTERLQKQGLRATVLQADVRQWDAPQPFDAIWEQTCLCALYPDDWMAYANRLHHWLAPHGRLFALFMQTPAGHPKLLHLWPVKLPQAGRSDYADSAAVAMREAASFRR
ncbi:SAM-dependent methyltransferase [Thiomonas arsenitoxydans]|uniref:SAM-dependent methyltransferase n=2 Tax=Thiomonas TaxID=32012 RepID=UPI0023F14C0F|nr:methyltransferase domain-containing protein [Thiomonas arsenitoxydans]